MGQVPEANPWLLVGDGRLALHLHTYLRQLDVAHRRWSRARGWHDARRPTTGLSAALPRFERILLAISDDALEPFVAAHDARRSLPWVHFSGGRRVVGAWAAHPLCTFAGQPYPEAIYREIPFIVEAEGPPLSEILPGLPNPSAAIPAADRALYHALCVAAGNFTTLLWRDFFARLEDRWGIDSALARPYLRRTLANLEGADLAGALTGPIARGDAGTIRRNLAALDEGGLDGLARVYRAFVAASPTPRGAETAA